MTRPTTTFVWHDTRDEIPATNDDILMINHKGELLSGHYSQLFDRYTAKIEYESGIYQQVFPLWWAYIHQNDLPSTERYTKERTR